MNLRVRTTIYKSTEVLQPKSFSPAAFVCFSAVVGVSFFRPTSAIWIHLFPRRVPAMMARIWWRSGRRLRKGKDLLRNSYGIRSNWIWYLTRLVKFFATICPFYQKKNGQNLAHFALYFRSVESFFGRFGTRSLRSFSYGLRQTKK